MLPTSSQSSNRFSVLAEQDVRLDMEDVPKESQQDPADLPQSSQPASQSSRNSAPAGEELAGTQIDKAVNTRKQEDKRLDAHVIDMSPNTTQNISVASEMQSKPNDLEDQLPEEPAEMPKLSRPKPWDRNHEYVYMPKLKLDDPWETIKQGFDKYDKEMCDAWNGELDTILTFTGLFSAAVTAFCIESFQSLSQNPADTTNGLLMVISQQLANSSFPVTDLSMVNAFTPQTSDVQVNVLYFVSLTLALSVSSVCILAKQWIREYQKDISVSVRDAVRIRQARFDSFETWKVPQIIGALPVILLAALMMFFSGLLIQLWNVGNQATAQVVTVIAALTVLLVVATTVIPALVSAQPRLLCFAPFRSPQAWIFLYAYRHLQRWFRASAFYSPVVSSWADYDLNFLKAEVDYENNITSIHRVLHWAFKVLRNSTEIEKALLMCLQPKYHPSRLISDITELGCYVLYNADEEVATEDLNSVYYNYYKKSLDRQRDINSLVGRHMIELLIRSASEASVTKREGWNEIQHSYQHILQDQLALLLEKIFTLSPPSHSFDWDYIIYLLLVPYSSPLSRQITLDIATIQLPAWIRKHASVSLSYDIGRAINIKRYSGWMGACQRRLGWGIDKRTGMLLFMQLDKIMVEWCSQPEGIVGLDERSVEQWRKLRLEYAELTREFWWPLDSEDFQSPDDYFDNLPGHGPLILAAVPSQDL